MRKQVISITSMGKVSIFWYKGILCVENLSTKTLYTVCSRDYTGEYQTLYSLDEVKTWIDNKINLETIWLS